MRGDNAPKGGEINKTRKIFPCPEKPSMVDLTGVTELENFLFGK